MDPHANLLLISVKPEVVSATRSKVADVLTIYSSVLEMLNVSPLAVGVETYELSVVTSICTMNLHLSLTIYPIRGPNTGEIGRR